MMRKVCVVDTNIVVSGDRLLVEHPPRGASARSPRPFVDTFLPSDEC